jgi:hypothetical protein
MVAVRAGRRGTIQRPACFCWYLNDWPVAFPSPSSAAVRDKGNGQRVLPSDLRY